MPTVSSSSASKANNVPTKPAKIAGKTLVGYGFGWATYANGEIPGIVPIAAMASSSTSAQVAAYGIGTSCNWIGNCSLYIYRGTTKSIANAVGRYANATNAAIAAAFATACAPLGGIGALVCGGIGAVMGGFAIDQFVYAGSHNQCIAISYRILPLVPYWIAPYNGTACKN